MIEARFITPEQGQDIMVKQAPKAHQVCRILTEFHSKSGTENQVSILNSDNASNYEQHLSRKCKANNLKAALKVFRYVSKSIPINTHHNISYDFISEREHGFHYQQLISNHQQKGIYLLNFHH